MAYYFSSVPFLHDVNEENITFMQECAPFHTAWLMLELLRANGGDDRVILRSFPSALSHFSQIPSTFGFRDC